MAHHDVSDIHNRLWTPQHDPVLTISNGDTISFDVRDAADGQLDDYQNGDRIPGRDPARSYPLRGPVMVNGAQAGDVLEIEPLEYTPLGWGFTASRPGAGLLPDDFTEAFIYKWDLSTGPTTAFLDVASVPLRPFLGVMACTPATEDPLPVMPPGNFGGNMDIRDLGVGTKIFLRSRRVATGTDAVRCGPGLREARPRSAPAKWSSPAFHLRPANGPRRAHLHLPRVLMPAPDLVTDEPTLTGRLTTDSNATFLGSIGDAAVMYKPIAGEKPLRDFPVGCLAHREVSACLVSEVPC